MNLSYRLARTHFLMLFSCGLLLTLLTLFCTCAPTTTTTTTTPAAAAEEEAETAAALVATQTLPTIETLRSSAHWEGEMKKSKEGSKKRRKAEVCWGLAVLTESQDMEKAMPLLLENSNRPAAQQDWILWDYIGGVYSSVARKILAADPSFQQQQQQQQEQEQESEVQLFAGAARDLHRRDKLLMNEHARSFLSLSITAFEKSFRIRSQQQQRENEIEKEEEKEDIETSTERQKRLLFDGFMATEQRLQWAKKYPQIVFEQPLSLSLRSWGDNLAWLGRQAEAEAVFQLGVQHGIWSSSICRPNIEYPTLFSSFSSSSSTSSSSISSSTPTTPSSSTSTALFQGRKEGTFILPKDLFGFILEPLQNQLPTIRQELIEALSTESGVGWRLEEAGLHSQRSWRQLSLMVNGHLQCPSHFPQTCALLAQLPMLRIANGQVKFSAMQPGTIVRPHCGPVNQRLRIHCTLLVPSSTSTTSTPATSSNSFDGTWMRVGNQLVTWQQDQCFVFDESCEHEVVYARNMPSPRIVLILDLANPFLLHEEDFVAAFAANLTASELSQVLQIFANFHQSTSTHPLFNDDPLILV